MKKEVEMIINTLYLPPTKRETEFGAYFTNSLEGGDAEGYAVATIERDDLEVRWTSLDMRISRAAKLAELFGKRLRWRYYEKLDEELLVWMIDNPNLRLHWHSDRKAIGPNRKIYCSTPVGIFIEEITEAGSILKYQDEIFTGLSAQEVFNVIVEKLRRTFSREVRA